jgi:radical SAM protein with 4Fe4S-binding SPASM domain
VDVIHWNFDGRIKDWRENRQTPFRCLRPDIEVIIDNYGEMRLCCQDWQGDVPIGNVWQDSLTELLKRRQSIVATIQRQMGTSTPERCRRCAHKIRQPSRIVK